MAGEEGDGGLPLDAPALGLVHGLGHGIQAGGAQQLHQGGLQEGDLLAGHHIGVLGGVHVAGGLLHLGEHAVLAVDLAHDDVLLAAVAAEAVGPGLGGVLVQQEGGVAGMGHAEGAVVPEGQLLSHGGGGIQDQEAGTGLEHGDIDGGELLDQGIGDGEDDHLSLGQGLLHGGDLQTAGADALDALGSVLHQGQVILVGQFGQVGAGAGAHLAARADDSDSDLAHNDLPPSIISGSPRRSGRWPRQ